MEGRYSSALFKAHVEVVMRIVYAATNFHFGVDIAVYWGGEYFGRWVFDIKES